MAKPSQIEARKAKAVEELGRKIDLIMKHLGVRDPLAPPPGKTQEEVDADLQAAAEAEAKADAEAKERAEAQAEAEARAEAEAKAGEQAPVNPPAADAVGTEASGKVDLPKVGEPVEKPQPKAPRGSGKSK